MSAAVFILAVFFLPMCAIQFVVDHNAGFARFIDRICNAPAEKVEEFFGVR